MSQDNSSMQKMDGKTKKIFVRSLFRYLLLGSQKAIIRKL
jgi:hypothetical protein